MPDCYRRSARRWVDTADPAEAAALAAGYAALLDDFPPTPANGDEAASLDRLVEAVRTVSSTWASRRSAIVASETVTDPASSKRKERRRLRRASAAESAAAGGTPPRECRRRRAYGATTNGSSPPRDWLSQPSQTCIFPPSPSPLVTVSKTFSPPPFSIDSSFIGGSWAIESCEPADSDLPAADASKILPDSNPHDDGGNHRGGSESCSGFGFGGEPDFAVKRDLCSWADDSDLGLHFGRPAADSEPPGDSHGALLGL